MTRFDTPLLDSLHITFFDQAVFDSPHLSQLISRTPNFQALDEARVTFSDDEVQVVVALLSPTRNFQYEVLAWGISRNAFTYAGVDICGESVGWITSRAPIG
jgi:hypothetical protein